VRALPLGYRAVARTALFRLATSERFEAAARRWAPVERRCYARALRYVAGTGWDDAAQAADRLAGRRIWVSPDFFGERVTDPEEARAVTDRYVELAGKVAALPGEPTLSIDLSHIGLDVGTAHCRALLARICAALPPGIVVQVGAEEIARHAATHQIILDLARDGAALMVTLQANVRASATDWRRFAEAGVPVRLVKGAYVEAADLAHPWGPATDRAYLTLAEAMHQAGHPFVAATHDPAIQRRLAAAMPDLGFEHLLGVRPEAAEHLAAEGHPVRVYVPFGPDWFRYWMRRLAESMGS
jgi:proline dehydrogenase